MTTASRAAFAAFSIRALAFLFAAIVSGWATGALAGDMHDLDHATPGIWVDPDGCQHYAMTDGFEGYMTPNMRPDGTVVCSNARQKPCLVADSDQLFAVDKYAISAEGRRHLTEFFRTNGATSFSIAGHTDSDGSDAYNMTLSKNRANAVAAIAREAGVQVASVQGFGKRHPRASNATAAGKALNRRVEIMCNN